MAPIKIVRWDPASQLILRVSSRPSTMVPSLPALRERRPIGRARDGIALFELMLALTIIGLVVGLLLPRATATGSTGLRLKAYEIAALLRQDRNEAVRTGNAVTAIVDLASHVVRSGSARRRVEIPLAYALRVSPAALAGIRFLPDGTATGGEIFLASREGAGQSLLSIRVNRVTSAVQIDGGKLRQDP